MIAGNRFRNLTLGALFAGGGLALLASTQPWVSVVLVEGEGSGAPLAVQGSHASPITPALGLAALALVAAVLLTGTIVRMILGVIAAMLGAGLVASTASVLLDPLGAAAGTITTATGVAGRSSLGELVSRLETTPWGFVAGAGGVLVLLAGVVVAVTARRWPRASHRYDTPAHDTRDRPVAAPASSDDATRRRDAAIDDWDTLSRGDDPTQ